jgi:outer membrane lipoprotein SlyB
MRGFGAHTVLAVCAPKRLHTSLQSENLTSRGWAKLDRRLLSPSGKTEVLMNQPDPNVRPNRRMHPLVATAVAAVIVASLAATAAVTGVFPKASNTSVQTAAVATQPAPEVNVPGATTSTQVPAAPPPTAPPPYAQTQPPPPPAAPAPCPTTCGTVEAISAVRHEGDGTGIGAVGGAVAGGVIGNQFGRGGGRTAMTLLGAVGGGLGGNAVEKHLRSTTSYSVRVRMENGRTRYFSYREAPPFQRGEHVHMEHGALAAG